MLDLPAVVMLLLPLLPHLSLLPLLPLPRPLPARLRLSLHQRLHPPQRQRQTARAMKGTGRPIGARPSASPTPRF